MSITLLILGASVVFFVTGRFRTDIVALCSLLALMLFNILDPSEALSGFSNTVVLMMIGLFVVGGAIFRTGLAKMISGKILKLAGRSEIKLFLLTVIVTASIGAFVSNTGTVALMLPITVSLAMSAKISTSRLLMPIAFASSMGGMLTLIGTPPNLVISEALSKAGYGELSFFSFTPVGLICVVVGIAALIPLSKIFLSKKDELDEKRNTRGKSLLQLAKEYQLTASLFRVHVSEHSPLNGKNLGGLDISEKYQLNIVEIRRETSGRHAPFLKTVSQNIAGPNSVILAGDIIYIQGKIEQVEQFTEDNGLELLDGQTGGEKGKHRSQHRRMMDFNQIGIAEVILMPNSQYIHCKIRDSAFRTKYGINILGIRRNKDYILEDLPDEKMEAGDALLIQGTWENIGLLSEKTEELVVVGQPLEEASKVTLDHKAPIAAVIMILMILAMALDIVPAVTAVLSAAVLMVLCGCLRNVEEAYKTINWESIVLIAAMLPMSVALEKTGVSGLIATFLVKNVGSFGPMALLAGVYFTSSLMTMFISNTATAVLIAPIAMKAALDMQFSPFAFLFAVSVGTSMCFASPFSTPPNALVMPAGKYTFMDYVKVGAPLQLIMGIVMVIVLPLLFPFKVD